jgi:hypothetical protein
MDSCTEKRFQHISWKIEADGKDVNLHSKIYNDIEKLFEDIKNENIVIAIGLNPSNTTVFNDDITNLYLRDKIHNELQANSYILTNLSSKIESDSGKITLDDFNEKHIGDIIELINHYSDSKIVIFFGQTGVDFLNNKVKDKSFLKKLKQLLIENKQRVLYTRSMPKFTHPGRSGQDYDFAQLQEDTLGKN